jgi:hypothetical protein
MRTSGLGHLVALARSAKVPPSPSKVAIGVSASVHEVKVRANSSGSQPQKKQRLGASFYQTNNSC